MSLGAREGICRVSFLSHWTKKSAESYKNRYSRTSNWITWTIWLDTIKSLLNEAHFYVNKSVENDIGEVDSHLLVT